MATDLPLERLVAVETKLDMLIESNKEVAKNATIEVVIPIVQERSIMDGSSKM